MAKKRREKTLADYVVIAISPVLIMALVGSLAFFLLELSYRGEFPIRLKWVLFCFVTASVLVARIAIEQGIEHARTFGFALVGVVGFAALRLIDAFVVAWVLMAISWWCTWQLTWDCTLIDEDEDASGEGLLQAAGLGRTPETAAGTFRVPDAATTTVDGKSTESADKNPRAKPRRAHAPGRWVVYFSLAALPLFGAGQLLIPARDAGARAYAFGLLALYIAAALGLLLTTSFLGLRRYLRQRKLQMPVAITGSWLGMGTALALALLGLALLLPQPQGEYTLTALVDKVDARIRQASRFAVVAGDRAQGDGKRTGEQDQNARQPGEIQQPKSKPGGQNAEAKRGQPGGENKNEGDQKQNGGNEKGDAQGKGDARRQGDEKQNQAGKERRPGERQPAGQQPPQQPNEARGEQRPPPPSPPAASGSAISRFLQSLAPYFKWLVYGVLALAGLYFVIRHRSQFVEFLARLWVELLSLFGIGKEAEAEGNAGESTLPVIPLRPFAAYSNPFFSGRAQRMLPAQLVHYTFEALEAWAREQVVARPPEQTPLEFSQELCRRVPVLAKEVAATAELYVRVAYARKSPSRESVEVLERLWRKLEMGGDVSSIRDPPSSILDV
jgi:hypothetical protein